MVDAFSGGAGLGAGGTTVSLDSGLTGHEPPLFSLTPSPLSFKATSGPRGGQIPGGFSSNAGRRRGQAGE